jgi:hypothetical protein
MCSRPEEHDEDEASRQKSGDRLFEKLARFQRKDPQTQHSTKYNIRVFPAGTGFLSM